MTTERVLPISESCFKWIHMSVTETDDILKSALKFHLLYVIPCMNDMSMFNVSTQTLVAVDGAPDPVDFISLTKGWLIRVCELLGADSEKIREGELAAFLSYAIAYPRNFLPVIDSYSVGW